MKAYFVAQQGDDCRVLLLGSRADDGQRGGDVNLLVMDLRPVPEKAWFAARLAAHAERLRVAGGWMCCCSTRPRRCRRPMPPH